MPSVSNERTRDVKAAPRSQIRLRADQAEGGIVRESFRIVHLLVARQATVD